MFIKNNTEYESFFKGGVEYSSFFKGGVEYGEEGFSYHPNLKAAITKATNNGWALPTNLDALNNYIVAVDDAGLLAKMDSFYAMLGDGDREFKAVNLASTAGIDGRVFGTTANYDDGIKGGAETGSLTGYINTYIAIGVNTTKASQNNNSIGVLLTHKAPSTGRSANLLVGTTSLAAQTPLYALYGRDMQYFRYGSTTMTLTDFIPDVEALGIMMGGRNDSDSAIFRYKDSSYTESSYPSDTPANYHLVLFRDFSGSYFGRENRMGMFWVGAYFDEIEYATMKTLTANYATELGLSLDM